MFTQREENVVYLERKT